MATSKRRKTKRPNNPKDATLRNVRASLRRDKLLGDRITVLAARVDMLADRVAALESPGPPVDPPTFGGVDLAADR